MKVDLDRLLDDIATLATFGATAEGGVDRESFSTADLGARAWLIDRCEAAGLTVRFDAVGNVFATLEGPPGPALWCGSHIDSVPDGGRYDGALGVLSGLECLRRLAEENVPLARSVTLVVFADEEGSFDHLLGSTALVEGFDPERAATLTSRRGRPLLEALGDAGLDVSTPRPPVAEGEVSAFVELHIEQGPVLERDGDAVGIVDAIVGMGGGSITFHGRADHAGTRPMDDRRDAVRGAADLVAGLPGLAATAPGSVATVGSISVRPGAANVVPRSARVSLDYRHPSAAGLMALHAAIVDRARWSADDHGLDLEIDLMEPIAPIRMDERVQGAIRDAGTALGVSLPTLPSGALHDAQMMARVVPTGMVFVRCRDGRSHTAHEHTDDADVGAGADVLLGALARLATQEHPPTDAPTQE